MIDLVSIEAAGCTESMITRKAHLKAGNLKPAGKSERLTGV
jgi:hypothetical protein